MDEIKLDAHGILWTDQSNQYGAITEFSITMCQNDFSSLLVKVCNGGLEQRGDLLSWKVWMQSKFGSLQVELMVYNMPLYKHKDKKTLLFG